MLQTYCSTEFGQAGVVLYEGVEKREELLEVLLASAAERDGQDGEQPQRQLCLPLGPLSHTLLHGFQKCGVSAHSSDKTESNEVSTRWEMRVGRRRTADAENALAARTYFQQNLWKKLQKE